MGNNVLCAPLLYLIILAPMLADVGGCNRSRSANADSASDTFGDTQTGDVTDSSVVRNGTNNTAEGIDATDGGIDSQTDDTEPQTEKTKKNDGTDAAADTIADIDTETGTDSDPETGNDFGAGTSNDSESETSNDSESETSNDSEPDTGDDSGADTSDDSESQSTDLSTDPPGIVAVDVENSGAECELSGPVAELDNPLLPDPFTFLDGTQVTRKDQWPCRRNELKTLIESFMLGEKPDRPDVVTGTVDRNYISVHVAHNGNDMDFNLAVDTQGSSAPMAGLIDIGGSLGSMTFEGVAKLSPSTMRWTRNDVPDGDFFTLYPDANASSLVAYAFGVSRIIDVIQDEWNAGRNTIIDPERIGVIGCSMYGQQAFVIGAFDERIALTIVRDANIGGPQSHRVLAGMESETGEAGSIPSVAASLADPAGWFSPVIEPYVQSPEIMGADTHFIVAMYAPRGLAIIDSVDFFAPKATNVAVKAGMQVFEAMGAENNLAYYSDLPFAMPCVYSDDQRAALSAAVAAFLNGDGPAQGGIFETDEDDAKGALSDWIDWETPALQ